MVFIIKLYSTQNDNFLHNKFVKKWKKKKKKREITSQQIAYEDTEILL